MSIQAKAGGGAGVPSDVEDPRAALEDSGGVGGELGPHQMFLSGEKRELGQGGVQRR